MYLYLNDRLRGPIIMDKKSYSVLQKWKKHIRVGTFTKKMWKVLEDMEINKIKKAGNNWNKRGGKLTTWNEFYNSIFLCPTLLFHFRYREPPLVTFRYFVHLSCCFTLFGSLWSIRCTYYDTVTLARNPNLPFSYSLFP